MLDFEDSREWEISRVASFCPSHVLRRIAIYPCHAGVLGGAFLLGCREHRKEATVIAVEENDALSYIDPAGANLQQYFVLNLLWNFNRVWTALNILMKK